jgi:phage baseplate assembly protein W
MSASDDPKSFLGTGWAFPVRPVGGRLRYVSHEDDIEQAIQIILLSARGERPMLPAFGAGLRDQVFEPNSPPTHRSVEQAVRKALVDWEPRILLQSVEVTPALDDPNLLLIHVDYLVRATNTAFNRVYPFYLLEGGA